VWERAVEVFHAAIPADDVRFVHRDFDQANLLWSAGT
jgi:aminoglycoside/choline kinase family phosphotransferase